MQIRAARDIEEGEELTTAYCAILNPAAKRQTDLAAYDFRCTCAACSGPSISDVKREGFSRRPVLVSPLVGKGKAKGDWLDPALRMLSQMEEEGGTSKLVLQGDVVPTGHGLRLYGRQGQGAHVWT